METKANQNSDEKLYDLWILLSRVYHMIGKLRHMELAGYDILPTQAYVLYIIEALGNETTPTEIARYVYQQKSSVSDILNRMLDQGLIVKTRASRGRGRITVQLTEKGQMVLRLSKKRELLEKVISALSPDQLRQLESCLDALRDNAIQEISSQEKEMLPPSQISKYYREKELLKVTE